MQRHDTDWLSLLAGIAALMAGGGYLVVRATGLDPSPAQVVAMVLLAAGVLGLLGAVGRLVRREDADDQQRMP